MPSNKKKIAVVDNSTWNIYNFRLNLIKRLKEEGYEVIVIAPVDKYIHYLNQSDFNKHIPLRFLSPQSKNLLQDIFLVGELYQILKREQPELVLNYTIKPNIYGNLAARWNGIKSIATITGLGYSFSKKNLFNSLIQILYRIAFRKVKKVVFQNPDDRALFNRLGIVDKQRSMIIKGSGVDTDYFRPQPSPTKDQFTFLFVGRLLYAKGIREYVKAAALLKQANLPVACWMIGDLDTKNPLTVSKKEWLNWMKDQHIKYFGVAKDVRKYIRRADVLVLPSYYREGIPKSILEAMAMAKPIITTNSIGCRETVQSGENGLLIPPQNAEALAQAMQQMYTFSEATLKKMGVASRARVLEEFDGKIITHQYITCIEEVLSTSTLRPTTYSTVQAKRKVE